WPKRVVSIHVRQGDFRCLEPGEDFSRGGTVRTPLDYFTRTLALINRIASLALPVTLFSDGKDSDLTDLLALPNVTRHKAGPAMEDLLLMSQSRILLPSAGSTFSYWAAFLSDAAVIMHPEHRVPALRPASLAHDFFEGALEENSPEPDGLLLQNIRDAVAAYRMMPLRQ